MAAHPKRMDEWKCPHLCGWSRYWSTEARLYDQEIDHPLYGRITSLAAAKADIRGHNCGTYAAAVARATERRGGEPRHEYAGEQQQDERAAARRESLAEQARRYGI